MLLRMEEVGIRSKDSMARCFFLLGADLYRAGGGEVPEEMQDVR